MPFAALNRLPHGCLKGPRPIVRLLQMGCCIGCMMSYAARSLAPVLAVDVDAHVEMSGAAGIFGVAAMICQPSCSASERKHDLMRGIT